MEDNSKLSKFLNDKGNYHINNSSYNLYKHFSLTNKGMFFLDKIPKSMEFHILEDKLT